MKKFLLVLAVGYGLLAAALFLMGQTGNKAKQGESQPSKSIARPDEKKEQRRESGQGLSERQNKSLVKAAGPASARLTASAGIKNFQTYYADGRVSSSWTFKDGVLDGTVLFYHTNGAVWMEIPFLAGQESGFEKEYDSSGRLVFEKQMIAGAPQGEVKHYYSNARLWMRAVLTRGTFETLPDLFSENGDAASGLLSAPSSSADGTAVFRVLTEQGEPKAEWSGSGQGGHSVAKTFFENGKPSSEWPLKEGRPNGSARFYYPEGSLWREIPLAGGQLEGKVLTFYGSGALQRETSYLSGRKDGLARLFYEDGSLWAEFTFEAGRLAGYPKAYSQGKSEGLLPAATPRAA